MFIRGEWIKWIEVYLYNKHTSALQTNELNKGDESQKYAEQNLKKKKPQKSIYCMAPLTENLRKGKFNL